MTERLEQNNSLGENSMADGLDYTSYLYYLPLWASLQSLVNQDRRSDSLAHPGSSRAKHVQLASSRIGTPTSTG